MNLTKSIFTALTLSTLVIGCKKVENLEKVKAYDFLVGTYTSKSNEGINHIRFIPDSNKVVIQQVITGIENPTFLAVDKTAGFLFSASEVGGEKGGVVSQFKIDQLKNSFSKTATSNTVGDHTCAMAWDSENKVLFAGNYSGGNIAVFTLDSSGNIGDPKQMVQHYGTGLNPERQEKPHVHDIIVGPNKRRVFVVDLGVDKVYIYDYHPENKEILTPSKTPYILTDGGSGPRHLIFDRTGEYLYLVYELSGEISVWHLPESEPLLLQKISLVSQSDSTKIKSGAEVKISPNGKHLYVTNRGDYNEIVVFAIEKNHQLRKIQTISSGGVTPRSFDFTPDAKYLLCANQDSNSIVVFEVLLDGKLKTTNVSVEIPKPVHIIHW